MFKKLAQWNVNHYNNHKAAHNTFTVLWLAGGIAVMHITAHKIAKNEIDRATGKKF